MEENNNKGHNPSDDSFRAFLQEMLLGNNTPKCPFKVKIEWDEESGDAPEDFKATDVNAKSVFAVIDRGIQTQIVASHVDYRTVAKALVGSGRLGALILEEARRMQALEEIERKYGNGGEDVDGLDLSGLLGLFGNSNSPFE